MIHTDTELRFIDDEIGFGVFATKLIPKGTIVWVLDELDQIFDPQYVAELDEARRETVYKYAFRDRLGKLVLCWDIGRFVNHSFHASCVGTAYDLELAARDILPGEQLTDDYGTLNMVIPFECRPEAGSDRTQALPGDLLRFGNEYDAAALDAFASYGSVAQPLERYVRDKFRPAIKAAVEEHVLLDSIRSNYFDDSEEAARK